MMYQAALDDYMQPQRKSEARYPIETARGRELGLDPRPRFFCAICRECRTIVDVLPARVVSLEEREAWWAEMDRRQLFVVARMARSLWQEGACTCERGKAA